MTFSWKLVAVGALGLAGLMPAGPEPPFALASRAARTGPAGQVNYLLPLLELRRQRAAYLGDPNLAGTYWQAAATFASLAGELDSAAAYWRKLGEGPAPVAAAAPATSAAKPGLADAAPVILAQTRTRQVVLFNEEHTQPRGRWLVGSLLPALWQQGFRVLALEALADGDTTGVRQRGFPVVASGYYTSEPHFGNLIRRARQLGFRVVAYDTDAPDREQGEARNLLAATGLPASRARVVVLAGHGHIDETPGAKKMAGYLHQLAGLDPLTIEQTQAGYAGRADWQRLPPGAYVVPPAQLPSRQLTCDLYVLNRLAVQEAGNAWGAAGPPTTVRVPADSLRPGQPHALLVYAPGEYQRRPDAVPVAVRCLWPGQATARLALTAGTYTVLLRDAQGQRRWQQPLVISH